ncbi:hypothetical protein [Dactylosporangium sp. NPDC051484]|uniref:hypothetical protein n=1 Tax=Dactylosporangium sp. NPDC051484 TaxID=3154942 RepID=UPI00344F7D6A
MMLRPEPLTELDAWLTPCRRLWRRHLDLLERAPAEEKSRERDGSDSSTLTEPT